MCATTERTQATVTYHLTLLPAFRFGFCLKRGFTNCAARVVDEDPMREKSSREIPSGLRAEEAEARLGGGGGVAALDGRSRMLRRSAELDIGVGRVELCGWYFFWVFSWDGTSTRQTLVALRRMLLGLLKT